MQRGHLHLTLGRSDITHTTIQGIEAFQRYRFNSGMTWDQLGHFVGISRKTLWSWCRSRDPIRNAKRDHVALILERTGINIGPRTGGSRRARVIARHPELPKGAPKGVS